MIKKLGTILFTVGMLTQATLIFMLIRIAVGPERHIPVVLFPVLSMTGMLISIIGARMRRKAIQQTGSN